MFGWLRCALGFHDLRTIGYPEPGSKQVVHYGCTQCKHEWGLNHRVQAAVPWHMVAADEKMIWGYDPHPATVASRLNSKNWTRK